MTADPVGHRGVADSDDCAIVGVSPAIRRAIATARQFAMTPLPILLMGPTGTGKELFAQEIHRWSGRRGRLVDVNCGALPRDLIEGELFGHRRGAFTGAARDSGGLIAHADSGTLFLDELSSLALEGQVKLLRALETREVRRVGDTAKRLIDFRLVAAVQNGLGKLVREGQFRIDLYQRLAGVVIDLPPLSERMEDALPLAAHFAALQRRTVGLGVEAVLDRHKWAGNVRELKTVVDRAVVLSSTGAVDAAAMLEAIDLGVGGESDPPVTISLEEKRRDDERDQLLAAAERNGWDRNRLARDLGVSVATMYRRFRLHGISHPHLSGNGASDHSHHSHPFSRAVRMGENFSPPIPGSAGLTRERKEG